MDTPGHVDFAYEVSRSLAACEGALLVVDAAQGVEAQTLANVYQSIEHDHEIVPVINKIDLPAAEPQKVAEEIEEIVGIQATGTWQNGGAVLTSAKSGIGVEDVLAPAEDQKMTGARRDRTALALAVVSAAIARDAGDRLGLVTAAAVGAAGVAGAACSSCPPGKFTSGVGVTETTGGCSVPDFG